MLASCFLNLQSTAQCIAQMDAPHLLLVCSGTLEEAAYEDALGAGALCERVWHRYTHGRIADSAGIARRLFHLAHKDVAAAFAESRNGRRLLGKPELKEDVAFCARTDRLELVAEMNREGEIRKRREV